MRALRHRNYRLFFAGHGLSLVGTWMQHTAMVWLVYEMTGSAALLGVVGFAGQIPIFLLSPVAGVMADRWDHRRALLLTQAAAMVHATIMTILVGTGIVATAGDWPLIALMALLLGTINAFDIPLRQAFAVQLVERREDLGGAIAMNSVLVNTSRLLGPSLAGLIIASGGLLHSWPRSPYAGVTDCLAVNAISYLAVLPALLGIRVLRREERRPGRSVLGELRDGAIYAWREPAIRLLLFFLGWMSLTSVSYATLLPALAKDILHGGPRTLGLLFGMMGAGAVAGNLLLAAARDHRRIGRMMTVAAVVFGGCLLGLSQSRWLWLSTSLLLVLGVAHSWQLVGGNTLIQILVHDDKRGRVMGLHAMAFLGMMPFGQLLVGATAQYAGTANAVVGCGLACLAAAALLGPRLAAIGAGLAAGKTRGEVRVEACEEARIVV
jgi:MFS family permease